MRGLVLNGCCNNIDLAAQCSVAIHTCRYMRKKLWQIFNLKMTDQTTKINIIPTRFPGICRVICPEGLEWWL